MRRPIHRKEVSDGGQFEQGHWSYATFASYFREATEPEQIGESLFGMRGWEVASSGGSSHPPSLLPRTILLPPSSPSHPSALGWSSRTDWGIVPSQGGTLAQYHTGALTLSQQWFTVSDYHKATLASPLDPDGGRQSSLRAS